MIFLYFLLHLLSGGSIFQNVDGQISGVNIAEEHRICEEATTRPECIEQGCFFDCREQKCLPMQYACRTRSTSKCFHLCNDQAACLAEPECTYNDASQRCSSFFDDAEDQLDRKGGKRNAPWRFYGNCQIKCDWVYNDELSTCNMDTQQNGIPSTEEMCYTLGNLDNICCNEFRTTTSTPRPKTTRMLSMSRSEPVSINETTTMSTEESTTLSTLTEESTTTEDPTTTASTITGRPTPGSTTLSPQQMLCNGLKNVTECKKNTDCGYNCVKNECVVKSMIREDCSLGCTAYCHDPCGCKSAAGGKCEFQVGSQRCVPRQPECQPEIFETDECARPGHYYVNGGSLCFNKEKRGKCGVLTNVLSVNANGRKHRDKRDVDFKADNEVSFVDQNKARRKFFFSQSRLNDEDAYLYEGLVSAIGRGNKTDQCLVYSIPAAVPGRYELTLLTYEPFAKRVNRRMFNIKMNSRVVVPNLDIFAVVGKDVPMSIVINYEVVDEQNGTLRSLVIKGQETLQLGVVGSGTYDKFQLKICVGECRLDKRFFWEIGNSTFKGSLKVVGSQTNWNGTAESSCKFKFTASIPN